MKKNVVFCGYGPLAYDSLKILLQNDYNIYCVLTHNDLSNEGVDSLCRLKSIDCFYQNPQKEIDFYESKFLQYNDTVLVSVNYRFILPEKIFNCFRFAFNLHGSILPKYRGRAPHIWSIINGERQTGVTSHIIVKEVDAGDIITQKVFSIEDNDTGNDIIKKYRIIYPEVLLESLNKLEMNSPFVKQNEDEATYFGKRIPEMGYIDPYKPTKRIIDFIRALAPPYPGAYFFNYSGDKLILEKVSVENYKVDEQYIVGKLEEKNGTFYLNCLENKLKIEKYFWVES